MCNKKIKTVPWFVYTLLAAIYIFPLLAFHFLGVCSGLFTFNEYNNVSENPLSLVFFTIVLVITVFICKFLQKTITLYKTNPCAENESKVNKNLIILQLSNILIPCAIGLFQGLISCFCLKTGIAEFSRFEGSAPYVAIIIFSIAEVCEFSLLFLVIFQRNMEG